MRGKTLWLLVLLVPLAITWGCGSGGDSGPSQPQDPAEPPPASDPNAVAILKLHNDARAAARPTPVPGLSPLAWSASAASAAQAWANGCSWGHDPKLQVLGMGQNIYTVASTSATIAARPSDVVDAWVSEVSDYDYATNQCTPGAMCGHYTQVVWRSTTGVGCAHTVCHNGITLGNPPRTYPHWDYWVCNYVPPGNVEGYKPY